MNCVCFHCQLCTSCKTSAIWLLCLPQNQHLLVLKVQDCHPLHRMQFSLQHYMNASKIAENVSLLNLPFPVFSQTVNFVSSNWVLKQINLVGTSQCKSWRDNLISHLSNSVLIALNYIRSIPRASLTLITFCGEFSNRQSHCRKHNLWLQHRISLATSALWYSTFLVA